MKDVLDFLGLIKLMIIFLDLVTIQNHNLMRDKLRLAGG